MQPDAALPPFNYHGYLPEGVHETTLEQTRERFVINPKREMLWKRLQEFRSIKRHLHKLLVSGWNSRTYNYRKHLGH